MIIYYCTYIICNSVTNVSTSLNLPLDQNTPLYFKFWSFLLTIILFVHIVMSVTLLKCFALHQSGHESDISGKQMFPQGRFTDYSSLLSSVREDWGVCRGHRMWHHEELPPLRYIILWDRHKTETSLTQLNGLANMPTRICFKKTDVEFSALSCQIVLLAKMHFCCG